MVLLVSHYTGNAVVGVAWRIFIVSINSLFTGMSALVARFAGASAEEKGDWATYTG
jgi:hypothetical protein